VIDRVTGLFVALGLVAATAVAAPPAGKAPATSAAVPVPRADFIRTMDGEFAKMDADHNKIVTRAEIEQYEQAANLLKARAAARALFVSLDTDKNGQLSAAEFDRMVVTPRPAGAGPVLAEADLNKDGRITLVEFRTAKLANFDRMDADKDGVVSVAEMRAAGLVK